MKNPDFVFKGVDIKNKPFVHLSTVNAIDYTLYVAIPTEREFSYTMSQITATSIRLEVQFALGGTSVGDTVQVFKIPFSKPSGNNLLKEVVVLMDAFRIKIDLRDADVVGSAQNGDIAMHCPYLFFPPVYNNGDMVQPIVLMPLRENEIDYSVSQQPTQVAGTTTDYTSEVDLDSSRLRQPDRWELASGVSAYSVINKNNFSFEVQALVGGPGRKTKVKNKPTVSYGPPIDKFCRLGLLVLGLLVVYLLWKR